VGQQAQLTLGFAILIVAGVLLTSLLRGRSIGEVLHGITSPTQSTSAAVGALEGSSASSGLPVAPSPAEAGSERSLIEQTVDHIAKGMGWSADDWKYVIEHESGFSSTAQNPSGAYGVGQALGATKTQYPKMVAKSPVTQTYGMAEYIIKRYVNPTNARRHEEQYNWY
jgi:resuscitation-promoting factor RpfB